MLSYVRLLGNIVLCLVVLAIIGFVQSSMAQQESTETESLDYQSPNMFDEEFPILASTTDAFHLPIIVYHIVRPAYAGDSRAVRNLAVTPEVFDAQLKYLKEAGYHVVTFDDLEAFNESIRPLPTKPIIINFDDGWRDQFIYAFPILQANNVRATFFIFTNSIDRPDFVTWDNIKEMLEGGMRIGSHSRSHPYLTNIADMHTLKSEIVDSKKILEDHLHIPIRDFAYPFGAYNPSIIELVKEAGYRFARADSMGRAQTIERSYELGALNVPTTLSAFKTHFP